MKSDEYRVQPGEMRSVAGAISGEALQAFQLLQRLQALKPPGFGLVGRKMQSGSQDLSGALVAALDTTLKRLQGLGMIIQQAADSYVNQDQRAARSVRRIGGGR